MSDKEHFDKMLLKELAWKLDREVWAHVQNPSPSEEWSTSKAREETRNLCAEYLGNLDEVKDHLSSKEQECEELKNIIFLAEIALKEIRLEPTMSGSVIGNFDRKKLATEVTAFYIAYHNSKLVMPNELILLRKRCEDLEAETSDLTKAISDYDNIISENYQSYKENKHILMEALKHARKGFLSAQMIAQSDFYEKIFQSHIQEIDKLLIQ
jgi:hypothetical protein